jgi:hypothetical protein
MANYERFDRIIDYILEHRRAGYDSVVAVTGEERSGKSALVNQAMIKIKNVQTMGQYKQMINNNIGYKKTELLEEITKINKYDAYAADEAIRGFYKRDWNNQDNKELGRVFTQIGFKKAIFFLCIPRFTDLDELYRNHRVRFWIHVIGNEWDHEKDKPGIFHAVVFEKDNNAFNPDPWSLKSDFKAKKKLAKVHLLDDASKKIAMYSECTAFMDSFTYPPVKDEWWEQYEKMSHVKKLDAEAVKSTNKYQIRWESLAKEIYNKGYTQDEVARWSGVGKGTINQQLSQQSEVGPQLLLNSK